MEYLHEFRFFVKEVVFSTSSHEECLPTVGIRLLDFPSLLVYPSDDIDSPKRYPKGKHCTFIMPIDKLLYQLKMATFPIQLYIIDHSNQPLKVLSRGFCCDKYLIDKLASLSTEDKASYITAEKVFYNRTIVVPVFEEGKFPVGSVTLKITAKIMSTSLGSCQSTANGQLLAILDPSIVTQSKQPVHKHGILLPNVWFPPPLCYTSNTISTAIRDNTLNEEMPPEDGSINSTHCKKSKLISKNIPAESTSATFLNPVADHWNVVAGCYISGSFPWKRHNVTSKFKSTMNQEKSKFEQQSGLDETRKGLKKYPCLSAMYRELISLHSNLQSDTDEEFKGVKECKDQSVQTDPPFDATETIAMTNKKECHKTVTPKGAKSHTHEPNTVSGDDIKDSRKQDKTIRKTDETQEDPNSSFTSQLSLVGEPEDIIHDTLLSDLALSDSEPVLNLSLETSENIPRNLASNNSTMENGDNSISQQAVSLSSSSSLSDIARSRPFTPLLTLSQPSIASISSQQKDILTHSSPQLLSVATEPTGKHSPSTHVKVPPRHPLHTVQSMESTLTLGNTTASSHNEVKCGNLGQKLYLAASIQSIDRETSSQQEPEYNATALPPTATSQPDESTASTTSEISELISDVTSIDKEKEGAMQLFELAMDYDDYSDDFESDLDSQ